MESVCLDIQKDNNNVIYYRVSLGLSVYKFIEDSGIKSNTRDINL